MFSSERKKPWHAFSSKYFTTPKGLRARVVDIFQKSGSHWVTHADWGCRDGNHQAWLIVDVDGKDEARQIVPPAFRDEAKVTGLNKFTVEEIDTILREHQP